MVSRGLAIERYSSGYRSGNMASPSSLINALFMSTVKRAGRTLVSIASTSRVDQAERWRPSDHLRFMTMLTTWLILWVLRVLVDHFPGLCPMAAPMDHLERPLGFQPLLASSSVAAAAAAGPSSYPSSQLALVPSSAAARSADMIIYEGDDCFPSVNALGRALSQVLALLNEIPASSRKYQFVMAMADQIMDENARNGHSDLLHINRTALASAFAHTSTLLCRSLLRARPDQGASSNGGAWPISIVSSLPLGNFVASYVKGVSAVLRFVGNSAGGLRRHVEGVNTQQPAVVAVALHRGRSEEEERELTAEKLAQELLWLLVKMKDYGAVDEALEQWSFSSALASASLTANPRVQGFIIKIFAILSGELARNEVRREVKCGLLVLWLPLCCHGSDGLSYPILTGQEKAEMERGIDRVISTLPPTDQEVVLTNWFQDFISSASDWPNLQAAYERWCHCSRKQLVLS
ncbi:hypothetical protein SAY87_006967 [Trapa incisa]|uniref:At3g05675-like ankyrin-like domain-containing protein n=1 Tax=Trapa incisa TaxID=236973 RepID=A0AAN7JXQ5_9MYRT|nr:hypothetical protein SAY87_006967 [Trapa incisa]